MLCTIPARAGSKRLPGKNLQTLAGRPLIAYTIEVARSCGASVPILMPQELCGDLVASHIPCQHMASHLAGLGQSTDTLVCLQPTSPLRSIDDLTSAANKFQNGDFDFLVSVTPVDPHDFHWSVVPDGDPYWH